MLGRIIQQNTTRTCLIFLLSSFITGAFRLYDVDNDGFITRDEMYNIVDAIYQMVVCITHVLHIPRHHLLVLSVPCMQMSEWIRVLFTHNRPHP